jgi:hypothetical protein
MLKGVYPYVKTCSLANTGYLLFEFTLPKARFDKLQSGSVQIRFLACFKHLEEKNEDSGLLIV